MSKYILEGKWWSWICGETSPVRRHDIVVVIVVVVVIDIENVGAVSRHVLDSAGLARGWDGSALHRLFT